MQKKLIVLAVVAVGAAGLGAALGYGPLLRYKTEGLLSMEMSMGEYKNFLEVATSPATAIEYASLSKPEGADQAIEVARLVDQVRKAQWLKPVYKISKVDAKEVPDALLRLDPKSGFDNNIISGIRLSHTGADPAQVAASARWLGAYFQEVAAREALRIRVTQWRAEALDKTDRALERKLRHQFQIEQAQARALDLRKIVDAYPDAARREAQQVIDIRKDNEKFMSPMAQLIGAESAVIETRELLRQLDREIEQQTFAKQAIQKAQAALDEADFGSEGSKKMTQALAAMSGQAKTGAQQEQLAAMTADVSQIAYRFLTQARMVAEPYVPERPEAPRPLMVIALSMLLGLVLSAALLWRAQLLKLIADTPDEAPRNPVGAAAV